MGTCCFCYRDDHIPYESKPLIRDIPDDIKNEYLFKISDEDDRLWQLNKCLGNFKALINKEGKLCWSWYPHFYCDQKLNLEYFLIMFTGCYLGNHITSEYYNELSEEIEKYIIKLESKIKEESEILGSWYCKEKEIKRSEIRELYEEIAMINKKLDNKIKGGKR